jgi:hypothetical protein
VFWVAIGLFLLLAPDRTFRSGRPVARRYGAAGCPILAGVLRRRAGGHLALRRGVHLEC